MATFTATMSGDSRYYISLEAYLREQSIGGNTSAVTWVARLHKTSGYGYWTSNVNNPINVKIDGSTEANTNVSYDMTGPESKSIQLSSGTKWSIPHFDDGAKSVYVEFTFTDRNNGLGTATAGGWLPLPTIPRASKITSVVGNLIGSGVTVNLERASNGFTHKVWYRFPNQAWQYVVANAGTSAVFTPPIGDCAYLPNSALGTMEIAVQTMNGNTNVGAELRYNHTMNVPSSIQPSFTGISHSEAVADVNNKVGAYVQKMSRIKLAINGATGSYGSTIKSYKIEFDGQVLNASSGTTQVLRNSGNQTIRATITDSRGRTSIRTLSINVLAYDFPKILSVPTFTRCGSDGTPNPIGTYVNVSVNISASSLVNGTQKNKLIMQILSKQRGSGSWTTKINETVNGLVYKANKIIATYSIDYAYDFALNAIDVFNTSASIGVVATGTVTMQWGDDWVSIGKTHERGGLDVKDQAYHNDGKPLLSYNGALPDGNMSDLQYLQSLKQGYYVSNNNPKLLNKPSNYAMVLVMATSEFNGGDGMIYWDSYVNGNSWRRGFNHSAMSDWILRLDNKNTPDRLIDNGSNANGEWWKYESGRLVQAISLNATTSATPTAWGSMFTLYFGNSDWTFPIPFVGAMPHVDGSHQGAQVSYDNISLTRVWGIYQARPVNYGFSGQWRRVIAEGKWK